MTLMKGRWANANKR